MPCYPCGHTLVSKQCKHDTDQNNIILSERKHDHHQHKQVILHDKCMAKKRGTTENAHLKSTFQMQQFSKVSTLTQTLHHPADGTGQQQKSAMMLTIV